ncbi:MAG TPA: N-acetylmuramoyl-L-alanine amidase, partial [Candidatus Alistipes excrementipullorum]|nr:N-acetylmuramoyl-L-alanine amidase [Candidatus Alistipes excrementipullorum]
VRAYIQNLQFTYGEYSEMMARLIQKNYAKSGRVARGIKRQPLKVLYATDMPSVLTEIGFMSNADELRYMCSEKGQNQIAEDLYNAVSEYVEYVRKSLLVDEPAKEPAATKTPEKKPAAAPKTDSQAKSAPAETAKPETKTPAVDSAAKEGKTAAASESRQTEKPAAAPKSAAPATKQAPKSEAKPAAADSGRAFTVQIMASSTQLASDNACFGSQRGKVRRYTANGRYKYKYCVGRYTDRAEAQRAAASLRKEFNGAFVVEVENGSVVKR